MLDKLLLVGYDIEVQINIQLIFLLRVLEQVPVVYLVINLTLLLHPLGKDVLVVCVAGFLVEGQFLGVLVE